MKEELEKLLVDRIDDLRDSIENGYFPILMRAYERLEIRKEKEEKLELLFKLKDALFGF